MRSEIGWFEKNLGDVTCNHDGKRKPVKESERKKGQYPYYGASGIVDHVDGYLFDGRYLLIAEDGENLRTRQTPIAFMADGKFWVNNHAHIVAGNGEVTTEYLCYFLQNADIQPYLTGAVMPKLTQGNLNRIPIRYPESDCQDLIVRVLGSLDAKIDLNRRINQTLEAMAQAIFKSWFVDFDPVKAKIAAIAEGRDPLRAAMSAISGKAEDELDALPPEQYEQLAATAALFPDEMVESELGEIPRGWEFKRIGDYLQTISKTFPLKTAKEVIFLNTGDIQNGEFLHQSKSKVATLPGQAKKSIQINDILYSEIRPENKRFAYVHFIADEYVVSTKLMVLRSKGVIDPKFLYFFLGRQNVIDHLQVLAESRSGTFPQITFDVLSAVEFLAPKDCEVANYFAETVVSQVMKITNSKIAENSKLANLRDTLLPKLLSGELSVEALAASAEVAG